MAARKSGLGRGLDALFTDNSIEEISEQSAVKLPLMDIEPNREQPRKTFDEAALAELADSIAQHGVIQPLLVRPMADGTYQLVAGERRWRAARMAGLTEVPVVIRELTDSETMELALIENLQREDLNPVEEAEALKQLMDSCGMTQEETARRVGRSRPAVANALRLLQLPEPVLELARQGKLSAGHARALLAFSDEADMTAAADLIVKKGISVREVERLARIAAAQPRASRPKRRDVYYDEVELALTQTLGRPVKVLEGKAKGTLQLEFYGKEDLAKLAKLLDQE